MSRPRRLGLAALATAAALTLWWLTFVELSGLGVALRRGAPEPTPDASVHGHLWRALYIEGADRAASLEAAVQADPASPTAHAARFLHALTAASSLERLGALADAGRRVDPDNALYDIGLAVATIDGAFSPAESADQEPTVIDRERCDAAVAHLLDGPAHPAARTYLGALGPLSLAESLGHRTPLTYLQLVDHVGRSSSFALPAEGALRQLNLLTDYARRLHADGQPDRAHALWARITHLATRLRASSQRLTSLFVALAVERHARTTWLTALIADGRAAEVDRQWRALDALSRATTSARALPRGVELSQSGVLDRMFLPVGGLPADGALSIGRRADYALLALAALALAALALIATACGAYLGTASPAPGPLATELAAGVSLGVLLPVAAFLAYDRWHPSRAFGLPGQEGAALQPVALALLVLVALLMAARRHTGAKPDRRVTALGAVALPAIFASFFWVGPLGPHTAVIGGALFAGAVLFVLALARAAAPCRRFVALAAATGVLVVLGLGAALVVPHYVRVSSAHADRVIRPWVRDEVRASNWQAVAALTVTAPARAGK